MGFNIPSFFGYFNAQRALTANQAALQVVNNNISNANTPGYSRQRVDMESGAPYPSATQSNLYQYGQTSQGVEVTGITRSHDNFIDAQIRSQSSLQNYQQSLSDALSQVESVIGEPSDSGISAGIKDFFSASQALSQHPEDQATRVNFTNSAKNMLSAFQDKSNQLSDLRTALVGNASTSSSFADSKTNFSITDINSDITQIANLNSQISVVTANGAHPNSLLDKRDNLLEELSKKINITVTESTLGQLDVKLGSHLLVQGGTVSDTLKYVENTGVSPSPDDVPGLVQLVSNSTTVNSDITGGELGGFLKMGGNDTDITTIRGMMGSLSTLFNEVATQVNSLQATGRDLNGNVPVSPNDKVFNLTAGTTLPIFRYSINSALTADPSLIAAASNSTGVFKGVGDGDNALLIAGLQNQNLGALGNTSISGYFNSRISQLGIDSKTATNKASGYTDVVQQLDQRRQSVQGVNIEEEMVNLLQYQRGFEASSRVMKALDDVMNRIINGML